jgi:ribosomal protein S18 acetylase RimI-like enzyme
MVKSGFASARFAVTSPLPNLRRMMATLRQFDESHKQQMPDTHWYLMALGVDPEYQHREYGSALVFRGLRRANDCNKPVYLETEAGANTAFYEKLGFGVLDVMTVDAIGLPFSLMIHRPETSCA